MNIAKEQADKVIAALTIGMSWAAAGKSDSAVTFCDEALSIMRGLAEDAEPVARLAVLPHGQVDIGWMGMYKPKHNDLLYTSQQATPTESHELDLSMMARRLIGAIRRIAEDDSTELKLANDSLKWLQSKALVGSPLRDTSPQAAQTEAQEREAFEAWIAKDCGDLKTFGEGSNKHYLNMAVNHEWIGWMKRAGRKG